MDFPSRLKHLRANRKLTQEQLGEKINVTKVSVSGYENGTRSPDMETLQKIADVFEVSVDFLLGRSDDPSPSGKKSEEDYDEDISFFDYEGLSEEDIEEVKQHIEFLRWRAKKHNERRK